METALTTAELAAILRLSASSIKRMRANGEIRGHKVRRQLRFFLPEVLIDLDRAESELEYRRSTGRLIRSHGKTATSLKGRAAEFDYEDEPNGGCNY